MQDQLLCTENDHCPSGTKELPLLTKVKQLKLIWPCSQEYLKPSYIVSWRVIDAKVNRGQCEGVDWLFDKPKGEPCQPLNLLQFP